MSDVGISVGIIPETSGARVIKRSLDEINTASKGVERQMRATVSTTELLTNAFKGMFAAFGVREVIRMADSYTVLNARMKSIAGSTQETGRMMAELRKISNATGSEMETSLSILQRLSFVRNEIKATNNDMLAFTETVTKLGVTSGALPEAMKAGLTQLGQALSSQYTRAEEFNSIMENIPAVGKAIADELGVTTGQMRLLVVEGKLLSSDVFAAILNQTEKVRAEFEQFPKTAQQGFKQMIASFEQVIAQANTATGATNGIGMALRGIGETSKAIYNGLGTAFDYLVAGIQEGVNLIDIAINKVKTSINDISKFIPGYGGTNFAMTPTLEVGSVFSAANAARKARQSALFGDDFSGTINPEQRKISQDYAKIAAGLNTDKDAAKTALREQKKLQDQLTDAVKSSRNEEEQLYDKIKEMERLRPFAKTAEQADAITKNIKNARDEIAKLRIEAEVESPTGQAFKRLAESIDDGFQKTWTSAFSQDKNGSIFKRMLDGMKQMFVNFLADLSYQALLRPVVVSVMGSVGGAMGLSSGAVAKTLGAAGSAAGGGGLSFGSLFSGASSVLSTGYSQTLGKIGGFVGSKIGGFGTATQFQKIFGNSAYGGLGSLGAQLLGLGSGNAVIDSGLGIGGSLLGSALGGPLGAGIGGFLGSALGGLFGGAKPSDKAQGGGINLANLVKYKIGGQTGSKYSAENAKFRDSVLGEASNLAQLFQSVGGTTSGRIYVTVGSRDGLRIGQGTNEKNFGSNSSAFINAVMQQVVKGTTGLNDTFKQILNKVGVRDTKKLGDAFAFGQSYLDAINPKSPADQLAEGIKALNDQFAGLLKTATDLGLPIEEYSKALDKQKAAAIGALKAQQAGFASLEQMTSAFDDFFTSQALGSNSSLNPMDKLQVAQNNFGSLLTKAQGGDLSVTPNLLNAANTLLDVGRSTYASGVDFTGIESFVKSSVQGVASQAGYTGQNVSYSIISTNQIVSNNIVEMNNKITALTAEIFRLSNKLAAA